MILIDYSNVAISALTADLSDVSRVESLEFAREKILNSFKKAGRDYKAENGEIVVCVDGGKSWRSDLFPYYKASRDKTREESAINWKKLYENIYQVLDEIRDNFPYKIIRCDRIEADDIIAVLSQHYDGNHLILSNDKDMTQLMLKEGVKVFSNRRDSYIRDENIDYTLFTHIVKGDPGDGITNILSDDDTLITPGKRQKPVTKKKLDDWYVNRIEFMKEHGEKFERNKKLISLTDLPEFVTQSVLVEYENQPTKDRKKILTYLISHDLSELVNRVGEF